MLVSVIVCSIDDAKLAAVTANYRERLAGVAHEIVAIRDARSLAEAYNRAARAAKGELLVFSHDDVEHLREDFARVLVDGLEHFDIVGAAGTTRCVDAYWPAAGHPHLHGACAGPAPGGGLTMKLYGVEGERAGGIQALDGMFIAARRDAWERSPFDDATFDGFHGYDADFAFSAAKLGLRVGVDNGFLVLHQSPGRFDERWLHYRERFLAKHFPGRALPPPQRPRLMVFPFASRAELAAQWNIEQARALTAQMHALAAGQAAG
jgi:GT2 family glycosyltransferase